ncbi:MAG: diacylglycerol kinase family lipid kinase [Candidatus Riflebacteria bacterium]|nr:diacylglycerol kinase family lipid kinase [Candidatus Riflebacteria bacterium]
MGFRKIAVIANPNAGRKRQSEFKSAIDVISREIDCEVFFTQAPGDAGKISQSLAQQTDLLITACGGDGTVNEVLNGSNLQNPIGIIPAGTANVIARELGIPLNLPEAAKNLFTGAIKRIDCGKVQEKRFMMVAGFGYDAHVSGKVNPILKKILGIYSYYLQAATMYPFYKRPQITIFSNGQEYQGEFALIANMRRYGGELFFAHDALYDDGMLDLVLFRKFDPASILIGLISAKLRKGVPEKIAYRFRSKDFSLQSSIPIQFQLDGEAFWPIQNARISLEKKCLPVIIP